jgi:hypothetical protein
MRRSFYLILIFSQRSFKRLQLFKNDAFSNDTESEVFKIMKTSRKNCYKNGIFDKHEWSAESYQATNQILNAFNSLGVNGKRIVHVSVIGIAMPLTTSQVLYGASIPPKILHFETQEHIEEPFSLCNVQMCEPVVLTFDDGSTFELQPVDGSLKMSVNQIPSNMTEGTNHSNFDANIVFQSLLGTSLKQMSVNTYHMESEDNFTHKGDWEFRRFLFRTSGNFGFSITHRYGSWYSFELRNQSHLTHDGLELVAIPDKEFQRGFKPIRQIGIVEGHDGSSYFWIMPIKQLTSPNEGDFGVERFREEEISIEEDDIGDFLFFFLDKYFDDSFPYTCRSEYYPKNRFVWNLEDNIYSYDIVRDMIAEIRTVAEMFQNDFDNPALVDLKSRFSPYTLAGVYEIEVRNMDEQSKNVFYRANIGIAIDFYNRFCRRMEAMMEHAPQYDLISFMGP